MSIATGQVRPPADYGPAIAALSDDARAKMRELESQGVPRDTAIAQAADWQNEQPRT